MPAQLLEGKQIAEEIRSGIAKEIVAVKGEEGQSPKLVAIQIGDNASSAVYIKAQKKTAESLGIHYELMTLPPDTSQSALERAIGELNSNEAVTAIILQLPVPKLIDARKAINHIRPDKDAEGMNTCNLGNLITADCTIGPCTAMAIMTLLDSHKVELRGKEVVIVGHSEIVGRPLALLLVSRLATVTVCHIATSERGNLADHVRRAEILIVAVGRAGVIKGEWIREGAVVVDVGINRVGEKIVGDIEFEEAANRAALITPVPGGVGPLTTTMLMKNTVELYKRQRAR